jgi:flagellar hook-length control protein FliK
VLTARLETETSAAQSVLLGNLPQLKERLAEQGMHIERFDVNVSGRNPGGTPDQPQNDRDRREAGWQPPRAEAARTTNSAATRRSDGTWDGEGLNVIV